MRELFISERDKLLLLIKTEIEDKLYPETDEQLQTLITKSTFGIEKEVYSPEKRIYIDRCSFYFDNGYECEYEEDVPLGAIVVQGSERRICHTDSYHIKQFVDTLYVNFYAKTLCRYASLEDITDMIETIVINLDNKSRNSVYRFRMWSVNINWQTWSSYNDIKRKNMRYTLTCVFPPNDIIQRLRTKQSLLNKNIELKMVLTSKNFKKYYNLHPGMFEDQDECWDVLDQEKDGRSLSSCDEVFLESLHKMIRKEKETGQETCLRESEEMRYKWKPEFYISITNKI